MSKFMVREASRWSIGPILDERTLLNAVCDWVLHAVTKNHKTFHPSYWFQELEQAFQMRLQKAGFMQHVSFTKCKSLEEAYELQREVPVWWILPSVYENEALAVHAHRPGEMLAAYTKYALGGWGHVWEESFQTRRSTEAWDFTEPAWLRVIEKTEGVVPDGPRATVPSRFLAAIPPHVSWKSECLYHFQGFRVTGTKKREPEYATVDIGDLGESLYPDWRSWMSHELLCEALWALSQGYAVILINLPPWLHDVASTLQKDLEFQSQFGRVTMHTKNVHLEEGGYTKLFPEPTSLRVPKPQGDEDGEEEDRPDRPAV